MDTVPPQKFPFILNRNLAKANCTGNRVCTSLVKPLMLHQSDSMATALKKLSDETIYKYTISIYGENVLLGCCYLLPPIENTCNLQPTLFRMCYALLSE